MIRAFRLMLPNEVLGLAGLTFGPDRVCEDDLRGDEENSGRSGI